MDEFRSPRGGRRKLYVVAALVFAALVFAIASTFGRTAPRKLATVEAIAIPTTIKSIGRIRPLLTWEVATQQSGNIIELLVEPGDVVIEGAALLRLQNDQLLDEVRRLVDSERQHQLQLQELRESQRTDRLTSLLSMEHSELALEEATLRFEATKRLYEEGIASEQTLTLAGLEKRKLESAARLEREASASGDAVAASRLALAKSRVDLAASELASARSRAEQLTVVAPINGRVQWVLHEFGSRVDPGTHVGTIAGEEQMVAELNVREHEASRIQQGADVVIITQNGNLRGTVRLIEPVVVDGTVRVEARFNDEAPSWLRANTPVQAEIASPGTTNVRYVDAPDGIRQFQDARLYRVDRKGEYEVVSVSFGRRLNATQIEVRSGLDEGDVVAISELPRRSPLNSAEGKVQ